MKKINAFFLAVLFLVLCSCATEEHTKNIIKTPDQMMGVLKVLPLPGEISATDEISIYAPQGAADAKLYYEIAVGVDCEEPTEKSTQYKGEFTISSTSLQPTDGDIITLKILAVKDGYEDGTLKVSWYYTDGKSNPPNDNAYLKSVTISGADFTFSSDVFIYNDIKVPNEIESVSLDYTKSDSGATVMEGVQSLQNITLTAGETKIVTLTVIASDKKTKKNYTFSIYRAKGNEDIKSRDCTLASLNVDGVSIAFDKNQTTYDVTFLNSIETTSVTYKLSNDKAKVVTTPVNLTNISLTAGQKVDVSITVTAEDPNYSKTYNISLYREPDGPLSDDATLKSLSVTGGTLSFNPATTQYNVIIPANYAEPVSVTYEKNHLGASITTIPSNLNNISIAPGTKEDVRIIVTAEDKIAKETYKVEIKREKVDLDDNANLSSITLSAGSLTPAFNADTLKYSVSVENAISSVSVTATPEDAKATVIITPSGDTLLEENKAKDFTISVTAEDGTGKDYVVSVTRAGVVIPPPPPPPAGKYYWTNKDGAVGKSKTITIDGDASDWSEDMKIAQGAAWDVANHWKGGHENCVLDTIGLYAAWDDENLYMGWQMVNTTDTWAREGDGPLSDGGRVLDVPLILALSVDSSSVKMSNKNATGGSIWGQKMGLEFTTHVDNLFYMSGKPGLGKPSLFKAVDSEGNTNYEEGCLGFKENNIVYKMAETNISSNIWGLNFSEDTSDVDNPDADWVDYKVFVGDSGAHKTSYDSFYEISIPFSVLGITKADLESKGIGAMLVATRGESALDCIPFDSEAMLDNATEDYGSDPSTSHEKDDIDNITVPLARVGHM